MSPIEEPKEPIFWLPFTRAQITFLEKMTTEYKLEMCTAPGYINYATNPLLPVLELAKAKLRCHDLLVSWPAPGTRVSRNLSLDELEIEL